VHKSDTFKKEKEGDATSTSQPIENGDRLIAKIYDPLYFNDEDGRLNPFLCVDRHYAHESRAYHVLSEMQGTRIPIFYGSYSLELPTHRTVRLILIEYIPGTTLQSLKTRADPSRTSSEHNALNNRQ
jgi:hypothetical protein